MKTLSSLQRSVSERATEEAHLPLPPENTVADTALEEVPPDDDSLAKARTPTPLPNGRPSCPPLHKLIQDPSGGSDDGAKRYTGRAEEARGERCAGSATEGLTPRRPFLSLFCWMGEWVGGIVRACANPLVAGGRWTCMRCMKRRKPGRPRQPDCLSLPSGRWVALSLLGDGRHKLWLGLRLGLVLAGPGGTAKHGLGVRHEARELARE